jgi:uncharacterized repeat protein (TIGR01451 family)
MNLRHKNKQMPLLSKIGQSVFIAMSFSLFSQPLFAVETISTSCNIVMTPFMTGGDRTHVDVQDRIAVIGFDYDDRGDTQPAPTELEIAKVSEVGTTWGSAYDAAAGKYYVAAFLRRHTDIAPDGLGAIYEIDVSDTSSAATVGTPTLWMDLNVADNDHLGTGATLFPNETAANRGLSGPLDPSYDIWAFTRVGKQGLGGLELSDDYSTMYAMDLTNRQLLVIDTASKVVTARHAITDPGCAGGAGDVRPFGVDYLNGDVYIGVTCSGETNSSANDVNSYVMKLDGGSFTTVVSDVFQESDLSWLVEPWTDDPYIGGGSCNGTSGENMTSKSTPVITNMELDASGNMIIGVTSVHGWRFGWDNYYPDTSCNDLDSWTTFGHVIRATPSGSTWTREADPTDEAVGYYGWGINNADGNNRGFIGGMSVTDCSGEDVTIINMQDPTGTVEGGTRFMRNADGQQEAATNAGDTDSDTRKASSRRLIRNSVHGWGKASGLGDVEYMSEPPACTINQPTVSAQCNNNGTPIDDTDDTFTYTINATGTGVGSTYSISGNDTQTSLDYGVDNVSASSFPIASGDLNLILTDDTTGSCILNSVTVTAPATCSSANPQVDVSVTKTVSPTSLSTGDTATYTVTVTNNGPGDATGVEVVDQLPAGVSYVSDTPSQGTYTQGTGIWAVGNLANGASATLTIQVTAN